MNNQLLETLIYYEFRFHLKFVYFYNKKFLIKDLKLLIPLKRINAWSEHVLHKIWLNIFV